MAFSLSCEQLKRSRYQTQRSDKLFGRNYYRRRAADFGALFSRFLGRSWTDFDARCMGVTAVSRQIDRYLIRSDRFDDFGKNKKLDGSDAEVRVVGFVVGAGLT